MLKQPGLNKLPFQGLPKLTGTGPQTPAPGAPAWNQALGPQPEYPFARGTETIRNTNPFTQQWRKYGRENDAYLQQNSALDPTLRAELEKMGDYYKRYYLQLQAAGGQPNEKGETPADQYLNYIRQNRDERMQKWVDVWAHLDKDTQQGFNRFARPEFREGYIDAMLAGQETVIMNVDGQDVEMRGFDAAKMIYRKALEWNQQEVARKYQEGIDRAGQNPYRVLVGGY